MSSVDPLNSFITLALWAVAVIAEVIHRHLVPTILALIEVATECSSAALGKRFCNAVLLRGYRVSIVREIIVKMRT